MKKISAIIFLFTLTIVCYGQVSDDFSDGDFSSNPTWSGSTSQFVINASSQLQLNSATAGSSFLSTPFSATTVDDYEWHAYVRQNFSSSGSNFGRIYLMSSQADFTQPLNGYYLQFGEAGSNDAIELFQQHGSTSTSVCRGTNGKIATSFAVRVKVTRDKTGLWQLYVDYTGGTSFVLDASGTDVTYTSSLYFGVLCTYTISNDTKFYYDDFYAGPSLKDITPPSVISAQAISANSASLLFSEVVDPASTNNVSNYSVDNLIGNPLSAALQADNKTVVLQFTRSFPNGISTQLTISGIKDQAGNEMISNSFALLYFQPVAAKNKDIIFTEIFSDPSPQIGLLAQEYVEIYNRSTNPFDLAGWKFSDGTSIATIGNQVILPGQYWIICSSSNVNLFSGYGHVLGISNFPTLNNDGDNLTLRDPTALMIDSVSYTLDWYHDVDKQEGGWSIEIIDLNNGCGEEENWAASDDSSGGTPGKQNSVNVDKPDLTGPQLLSVTATNPSTLLLIFNEKLEKDLSGITFTLSPFDSIAKKYYVDLSMRQIILELSQPLALRQLYTLSVRNLTDCAGNFIQQDFNQLSFALPEAADSLDLVVNEILFNPRAGGVDFVEIYNRSPKYINVKNWHLGNYENNSVTNLQVIASNDYVLSPASYTVFTSNPSTVSVQYPQAVLKNLTKSTLPSLPDDQGSIALVNDQALVIDHFNYSQGMHSPFIKDNEGVSLERISAFELTNDANNWRSASASAGFATPGFVNSNSRPESSLAKNAVTVDPEIFSSSAPGRDFSKINYQFDQSGMVANLKILDLQGRLIKTLANNETLGYEGFFRWDGDRDDGSHARVGYYVVWFEVFDSDGSTNVFHKRAVIGK